MMTAPHCFEEQGFLITEALLAAEEHDCLTRQVDTIELASAGTRNLLTHAWCADLSRKILVHPALSGVLPPFYVAVQCTFFQKSSSHNWLVPMHQDLSVPVYKRVEHPELTGWSEKEGNLYVQPPDSILGQLLIVRLHIDDCGPQDGPLRVVPGSHRFGKLDSNQITAQRDRYGETVCSTVRGHALVMRPLLLHASSRASGSSLRRVLHFVFGPSALPFGLTWHGAA